MVLMVPGLNGLGTSLPRSLRTIMCPAAASSAEILGSERQTRHTIGSVGPFGEVDGSVALSRTLVVAAQASGRMFWFMRKKFFGSYFALIRCSRR